MARWRRPAASRSEPKYEPAVTVDEAGGLQCRTDRPVGDRSTVDLAHFEAAHPVVLHERRQGIGPPKVGGGAGKCDEMVAATVEPHERLTVGQYDERGRRPG